MMTVLRFATALFVVVVTVMIFSCEARVELRLVGKHDYEGRVEAFVDGVWGPISAKSWDKNAAQVVCRQLGYSGKILRYTGGKIYGHPNVVVPVWLSYISCKGYETELDQCTHSGWGPPYVRLDFYDLAGVICHTDEGRVIESDLSLATKQLRPLKKDTLQVRLQGRMVDGVISEGFLMVSYQGNWGHVCADGWDSGDARVACGHLGFPEAVESRAKAGNNNNSVGTDTSAMLRDVDCLGHESSLFSCEHGGLGSNVNCVNNRVVWLKCHVLQRTNQFKNSIKLKLRGGAVPWSGRVEVYYDGTRELTSWCTLCDDDWDLKTANVVCRNLGYGTAKKAYRAATFGQGALSVFIEAINCTGLENSISDCKWTVLEKTKCSHFEDASVTCNVPKYHKRTVRLRGGRNDSEGRVEVFVNGHWGTVCGDSWNMRAAMMVCRELKSTFAAGLLKGKQFGAGGRMVMSHPICFGDERSLTHCLHDDTVTCPSDNVAAVRCTDSLPDLALSIRELSGSFEVAYFTCDYLQCSFEENCLASKAALQMPYGNHYKRRLMRFSTKIFNLGFADYRPWAKKEDWVWHSCHKHYHSQEEFAIYDLLTRDNRPVAEGHKASFCLEDTNCLAGVDRKYNCTAGTQGISVNCFDNYAYDIDCQWIDVTEVPYDREYVVQVNINPKLIVAETDFDNNVIRCDIRDQGSMVHVRKCQYDYCTSGLRSHDGNANSACCVFPFLYKGKTYETCTKTGYTKFWCATSTNYNQDKRWGLC